MPGPVETRETLESDQSASPNVKSRETPAEVSGPPGLVTPNQATTAGRWSEREGRTTATRAPGRRTTHSKHTARGSMRNIGPKGCRREEEEKEMHNDEEKRPVSRVGRVTALPSI